MFSVEHASSMIQLQWRRGGGRGGGGGGQASCLVAKQAVEFPQALTSTILAGPVEIPQLVFAT